MEPARDGSVEGFVLTLATAHCPPPIPTTTACVSLPADAGVSGPVLVVRLRPSSPKFHATGDGRHLQPCGVRRFPMPADRFAPLPKK